MADDFVTVKMPDGTALRFPSAMSQADMRTAAQGWWAQNGGQQAASPDQMQAMQPATDAATMQAMQPLSQMSSAIGVGTQQEPGALYQNLIGYGAIDTPGEKIGNVLNEAGRGVARGVRGAISLPALGMNLLERKITGPLGARIAEATGGISPEESAAIRAGFADPNNAAFPAQMALPAGVEAGIAANPQSTAAEYAGTAGEFIGGGLPFGGAGVGASAGARALDLARNAIIPGVASEAAGQATEGTALEPYARFAAGLLAPAALSGVQSFGRGVAGIGKEQAAAANTLLSQGIRPTAGQASGSEMLRRMEGRLQPSTQQLDDFTAATMRQLGSQSTKATPEALRSVEQALVKQMDDAVSGATIVPARQDAQAAMDIARRYAERVPVGQLTPRVRGIAEEITKAARAQNQTPLSLSQLKEWRSDIGKLTVSPDAATREAAHGLRALIDNMTDATLRATGREADIGLLAQAREAYRNFIGVRDAASRAGAEMGDLSPTALNQSMIRAQGREAYATGRATDMADFTRAAAGLLRPAPTVAAGGVRNIAGAIPAGLGAAGGAAGFASGGPVGAAIGGLLGAAAPTVGQAVMRSGPVQALLADPSAILRNMTRVTPGLLTSMGQQ